MTEARLTEKKNVFSYMCESQRYEIWRHDQNRKFLCFLDKETIVSEDLTKQRGSGLGYQSDEITNFAQPAQSWILSPVIGVPSTLLVERKIPSHGRFTSWFQRGAK